jgi:hypothetical protein
MICTTQAGTELRPLVACADDKVFVGTMQGFLGLCVLCLPPACTRVYQHLK